MKKQTWIEPGQKYNRLTVVKFSHTGKHHRRYFVFKCDCGKSTTITAEAAISGNTKSCGCLARESKASRKLPNNAGVINQLVLQYKRHAKGRGIHYGLSRKTFESIVRSACRYCGIAAGNTKRTKNERNGFPYNGIDRVNPRIGYRSTNVAPCCGACNSAKGKLSSKEFIELAMRIAKHQEKAMAEQWG